MQIELLSSRVERTPGHLAVYDLCGSISIEGKVYSWRYSAVPAHAIPAFKDRIGSEIVAQWGIINKLKELI